MENKMTFEESLQRLEEIVRAMERGDVPLDKSLELFQEGTALIQACGKLLDAAELQIKMITPDEDGAPVESDFQADI